MDIIGEKQDVVVAIEQDEAGDVSLREQIRLVLEHDKRVSQARLAKETGVSATTISQWLSDTYPGDNGAVESKLERWLPIYRRAGTLSMPAAPSYVSTPTAERVIAALGYAQMAGDIAVIYGGAGLGKTTAIRRYAALGLNCWVATMTPARANVVSALEEIAIAVGAAVGGGADKLHRGIERRVMGTAGLLVIDEAQHLSIAAKDQIRALHDATGIGIAFVGNEMVYSSMTGGNRAAFLDRLFSRIGKRVKLPKSTRGDIDAVLKAWGAEHMDCRAHLVEIGEKPGALRALTKVLRLASMRAAAAQRAINCADVRGAQRELGGEA